MVLGEECYAGDADGFKSSAAEHECHSEEICSTFPPSEKIALLGNSCEVDLESQRQGSPLLIRTYKSRFWIAFITSLVCWLHTLFWGTWGPISESMYVAFPGWDSSTVALMVNIGTIMYVLLVIPMSWAMERFGLRASVVASAALMAFGTAIRCFTKKIPAFTVMSYICAILVGSASVLALISPIIVANEWFPPHERTTAVGVILGFCQLGSLGSYLEPLIVRQPAPGVSAADIQHDVMNLMYAGAIMSAVVLLALLVYYPSKPPLPPSISSTSKRIEFFPGLASIIRNRRLLLVVAAYGVFVAPPIAWITVLDLSLLPLGFHQNKAMWIGCLAVIASSTSPILVGRLNDHLQGHVKTLLIILMLATTAFFYWFLLLSYGVLEPDDWQVYTSVIGGCTCNYAAMPLFYEVAVDMAFPVNEVLLTGVMTAFECFISTIYLSIYSIPNVGYLWITDLLTLTSSLPIVPLLFIRFDYTRANIDGTYYE